MIAKTNNKLDLFRLNQLNPTSLQYYTDYVIVQHNGQRIFSPPSSLNIPQPPKGTEIFVGNLTPHIDVKDILQIFTKIGPVYSIRLMVDFNNKCRGYAFVRYYYEAHVQVAIFKCNNQIIVSNLKINVYKSVDNCRLYIRNIPKDKTNSDVLEELCQLVDGIIKLFLYKDPDDGKLNRGYVFVEFENHRMAAIARRQLMGGGYTMWGNQIFVDWADPEPLVDNDVLQWVTILFLRNIPVSYSLSQWKRILFDVLHIPGIARVYKHRHYSFIHFESRVLAEEAFETLRADSLIANIGIEVAWAKPCTYSKKSRMNTLPNHFCLSVPPTQRRLLLKEKSKKTQPNLRLSPNSFSTTT